MADSQDPDHDPLARVMGVPCPFPKDDPRHQLWEAVARVMREAEAQVLADMLAKAQTASLDEWGDLLVETQVRRFDYSQSLALGTVSDYPTAERYEAGLASGRIFLLDWFRNLLRGREGRLAPSALVPQLQMRLDQRVAHWTAQALRIAREADIRALEAATQPATTNEADSPVPSPPNLQTRAEWLQEELSKRGWTAHDPRGFDGPDFRTIRKILDGKPVGKTVLEKLAHCLSRKGSKVQLRDIPSC